ncbi:MAG: HPF/RaiA family ribosome-associated protein [Planctomycetota bacterium]|jgi:hypothetical protein
MQVPVQVTFRDMPVSDAVEAACWDEAAKLERDYENITSCRIAVAESDRRGQKGHLFEIRIVLNVPGRELVVNREPPLATETRTSWSPFARHSMPPTGSWRSTSSAGSERPT